MDAFWRFWENRTNLKTFMNAYMRSEGLVYQESMIGDEFHFFPAPGRLFAEDTLPKNFVDPIGSIIFLGVAYCFYLVWERPYLSAAPGNSRRHSSVPVLR